MRESKVKELLSIYFGGGHDVRISIDNIKGRWLFILHADRMCDDLHDIKIPEGVELQAVNFGIKTLHGFVSQELLNKWDSEVKNIVNKTDD